MPAHPYPVVQLQICRLELVCPCWEPEVRGTRGQGNTQLSLRHALAQRGVETMRERGSLTDAEATGSMDDTMIAIMRPYVHPQDGPAILNVD